MDRMSRVGMLIFEQSKVKDMDPYELACLLKLTPAELGNYLGRIPLTDELAGKLEPLLGIPKAKWLELNTLDNAERTQHKARKNHFRQDFEN